MKSVINFVLILAALAALFSATSSIVAQTTVPAGAGSYLGGNLTMGYTWNGTNITFWLDTPIMDNWTASIAHSLGPGMNSGWGLACRMPTATMAAWCTGISTMNGGAGVMSRADSSIQIDSAWTASGRAYVIVTLNASMINITNPGHKRMIMCSSMWNSTTMLPMKHASSADRAATMIDFQWVAAATTTTYASTVPASAMSYLGGNLTVGHTWNGTKITFWMDTPTMDNWTASLAIAAGPGMDGGMGITCRMPTGTMGAWCGGLSTSNAGGAMTRTDASVMINSAWVNGGRSYVIVTLDAANIGLTMAGTMRTIMCVSMWNAAAMLPMKHANMNDRAPALIDYVPVGVMTTTYASTVPAGAMSYLSGNLTMGYTWNGTKITFWMDTPTMNNWAASLAIAAGPGMDGGMGITCRMPTATMLAWCGGLSTSNAGGSMTRTDASVMINSAWVNGGRSYVIVTVDAANIGVTQGTLRTIVCVSMWNSGTNLPMKHANANDRAPLMISYMPVGVTMAPTTTYASTVPAGAMSYLSGNLTMGYTWNGTKITFWMDTPTMDNWTASLAIASAGSTGMDGGMGITCRMPTATMMAWCGGLSTSNAGGAMTRTDASVMINSAWVNGGRSYVIVTVDAANIGLTMAGTMRTLLCVSMWNAAAMLPFKHANMYDRSPYMINYMTVDTPTWAWITAQPTTTPFDIPAFLSALATELGVSASIFNGTEGGDGSIHVSIYTPNAAAVALQASQLDPIALSNLQVTVIMVATTSTMGNVTTATAMNTTMTTMFPMTSVPANANSYLSGALTAGFTWNGTKITLWMDTAIGNDWAASWALSAGPGMDSGLGISCRMPNTMNGNAMCVGISTMNGGAGVMARADTSIMVEAAWTANNRAYVTVTVDAANLGITAPGMMRTIMAVASWNTGTMLPNKHATPDRAAATLDYQMAGATMPPPMMNTSTTMMMPPPPPTTAPANAASYLNGALTMGYTWNGTMLSIWMDTALGTDWAASIANSMGPGMAGGHGFTCRMQSTVANAWCGGLSTMNGGSGVMSRQDPTIMVGSSWTANNRAYVIVNMNAATGLNITMNNMGYRLIMAVANWNPNTSLPMKHATPDRAATVITFMNSAPTTMATTMATTMTNTTMMTSSSTTTPTPTTPAPTTSAPTTTMMATTTGAATQAASTAAPVKRNPRVEFVLTSIAKARSNTTAANFKEQLRQILGIPENSFQVTYDEGKGAMIVEFVEDFKTNTGFEVNATAEFEKAKNLDQTQLGSLGAASVTSIEPAPAPGPAPEDDGPDVAVIAGAAAGGFIFLLIILFIIKKQSSGGSGFSSADEGPGDRPMLEVPQQGGHAQL